MFLGAGWKKRLVVDKHAIRFGEIIGILAVAACKLVLEVSPKGSVPASVGAVEESHGYLSISCTPGPVGRVFDILVH
jgi:hypothetical protein